MKSKEKQYELCDRYHSISYERTFCSKSWKVSQYLAVAGVFAHGYARELELIIEDPEDLEKIMAFIVSGESKG